MLPALVLLFSIGSAAASGTVLQPVELHGARREPVSAVFLSDDLAAIACAKSGTLIFWDVKHAKIKQEYQVGKQLRGVAIWRDNELLVIDDRTHELIQLRYSNRQLMILNRYAVPPYPVHLSVYQENDRHFLDVASLWSRQISCWESNGSGLRQLRTIDLPFEPKLLLTHTVHNSNGLVPETFRFATAAFSGQWVEYSRSVENERFKERPIHNIGGLAFDPVDGNVWCTYQTLNSVAATTVPNIAKGALVKNRLGRLSAGGEHDLPRVIPSNDEAWVDQNADPAGIAFVNQCVLICLSGVDQVWYGPTGVRDGDSQRLPVGKRPRTIIARGDQAFVLGELDDSVTWIDVKVRAEPAVVHSLLDPASAKRQLTPAERGERLFFDARMSIHGRMSCHSCHPDGNTNGLLADTLGDNTHGTPKRVLTLRGTRMTDLWAWNGEMKTLQDNVHKSLQDTMHAPQIEPRDVDDLVSFLHMLPPVPPLKPQPKDAADAAQVARGEKIFSREGCVVCHVPPLTFTSHAVYDVGMPDEKGLAKFNPPSLRGVGRLRRLFHDNRAKSLKDVFETYGHQLKAPLSAEELADLVRYLESL